MFGEDSALNHMIHTGFAPLVDNIDNIFQALSNLISFKRNTLDAFLSENYDREKLLRNIGDIAVKAAEYLLPGSDYQLHCGPERRQCLKICKSRKKLEDMFRRVPSRQLKLRPRRLKFVFFRQFR